MKVINEMSIPFNDRFILDPVEDGNPYIINVTTIPESSCIEVRGHMADGTIFHKEIRGSVDGIILPLSRRDLYVLRHPDLQMYRISQGKEGGPLAKA